MFDGPWPDHIAGDGVVLRKFAPGDAASIVAILDDPQVAYWTPMPTPFTRSDAETMMAPADGSLHLAITRDGGEPVGLMCFRAETSMVSYAVAQSARGQGLAYRALQAFCRFARESLHLSRLSLEIEPTNAASVAVAVRAGFSLSPGRREEVEDKGRRYELATWRISL